MFIVAFLFGAGQRERERSPPRSRRRGEWGGFKIQEARFKSPEAEFKPKASGIKRRATGLARDDRGRGSGRLGRSPESA